MVSSDDGRPGVVGRGDFVPGVLRLLSASLFRDTIVETGFEAIGATATLAGGYQGVVLGET